MEGFILRLQLFFMHERLWDDGKQKPKKNMYWQHSGK